MAQPNARAGMAVVGACLIPAATRATCSGWLIACHSCSVTAGYEARDRLAQYGAGTYRHTLNGERLSETAAGQLDCAGNVVSRFVKAVPALAPSV